jgi:hypothetical protein
MPIEKTLISITRLITQENFPTLNIPAVLKEFETAINFRLSLILPFDLNLA